MDYDLKQEYADRLYEELFDEETDFCSRITWLAELAQCDDSPDRYANVWSIYLAFMSKIGHELFDSDVYWNPDSYQIEPVLDKLLVQGYSHKIFLIIWGARNLLLLFHQNDFLYYAGRMRDIAHRYSELTEEYMEGGILFTPNRMAKWEFIDYSNHFFGLAYDIVEALSLTEKEAKELKRRQNKRKPSMKAIEKKFDELFDFNRPKRPSIKNFFKKIFAKK